MSRGGFIDRNLMKVNPLKEQFEPTEAQPIRQRARMAGDPFVSQAQRAFMYAKHPDIAKRWEKHTPPGKLPAQVKRGGKP